MVQHAAKPLVVVCTLAIGAHVVFFIQPRTGFSWALFHPHAKVEKLELEARGRSEMFGYSGAGSDFRVDSEVVGSSYSARPLLLSGSSHSSRLLLCQAVMLGCWETPSTFKF